MDTSPEYARMCDCPEIQADNGRYFRSSDDEFYHGYLNGMEVNIYLPRQDQLIEMFEPLAWGLFCTGLSGYYTVCALKKLRSFHHWAMTPEKALLKLLMKELHNKKWNGKAWEKCLKTCDVMKGRS